MTETNTKKPTLSPAALEYAVKLTGDLAAARRMLQGIYAVGSPVLPREVFDAWLRDWPTEVQRDVAAKVVRERIVHLRSALARLPLEVAEPGAQTESRLIEAAAAARLLLSKLSMRLEIDEALRAEVSSSEESLWSALFPGCYTATRREPSGSTRMGFSSEGGAMMNEKGGQSDES